MKRTAGAGKVPYLLGHPVHVDGEADAAVADQCQPKLFFPHDWQSGIGGCDCRYRGGLNFRDMVKGLRELCQNCQLAVGNVEGNAVSKLRQAVALYCRTEAPIISSRAASRTAGRHAGGRNPMSQGRRIPLM